MSKLVYIPVISFAFAFSLASAQTAGDYQSSGTVDLNAATNWQTWNGSAWVTATIEPDGNIAGGNTITVLPGNQWNNSSSSTIPSGATLLNQGTTGTFTTSASNKVVINGTYVHNSTSSISTILQGMTLSSGSNFIYRGSSTLTPAVSFSNRTYYNLALESVSGSYAVNLAGFAGGTNPLTVNGTFSVGNNVTLNQNTFTGMLNFNGDMSVSGKLNINSFSIAANKTLTISSPGIISIPINETITVNGTADATTGMFSGAGNLVVNGTLRSSHTNGIGATGSLANTGTISIGASSTIEFNANGDQVVSARNDYANIIINGTGNKNLEGNISLSGNLALTNGYLVIGAYDASISGTATGSAMGYIKTNGTGSVIMKNILTDARDIPVGNSDYNPLVISKGDGLDWTVNLQDSLTPSAGFLYTSRGILRTWKITASGSPAGATLVFQYDDSNPLEIASSFQTNAAVQVWNYHGGLWSTVSLAITPTGPPGGGIRSVTISNQSGFSPFIIANVSGPLPVTISSFNAVVKHNSVDLQFINDAEFDIEGYFIERVEEGRFIPVTHFLPEKNDGSKRVYQFTDFPPRYIDLTYRIRAAKTNGEMIYSNIIRVKAWNEQDLTILMDRRQIHWQAKELPAGKYHFMLLNLTGGLIFSDEILHPGGDASGIVPVKLPGMYILLLQGLQSRKRIILTW
jgi:hypothetical protein